MNVPQSLPSFAQAFSTSSLNDPPPISNALPPIQRHSPPPKKRSREDNPQPPLPGDADATRQSPLAIRIKEEDRDDAQRPSPSPPHPSRDSSLAPAIQPLSKKRRVTTSGPAEQGSPIPISPAAPTLCLPDDQPRTKQLQKTTTDQRSMSGTRLARSPSTDQLKLARMGRVSPSTIPAVNRCAGNPVASGSQATASSARPLTPPPIIAPQPPPITSSQSTLDPSKQQQSAATHSLPPPPISFARRRAAQSSGRKKKPADILISPRGAGPSDPLAPVIQSAPPVADPGRFPMAIPRLPLALSNTQSTRRVAGNVPPTPTRFSLQGTAAAPSISSTGRTVPSPPNVSVPIASALVPPTPHALQLPGYSGDKSAFLAPFEVFYDALNDSKQLKGWLSEQLQKSNALMMSLKQQQEKMDEIVEDLVEKRTRGMREEMAMLRQRMESLEEALLAVRAESSTIRGHDVPGFGYPQSAKSHQNGIPPGQRGPDAIIGAKSPGREQEHQPSMSPPVEVSRRPSISAASTRPESQSALHPSLTLGGHSRRPSGSQNAAKSTPPVRPPSTARVAESRSASRMYYPGTYGNGNGMMIEGQTCRDGTKS